MGQGKKPKKGPIVWLFYEGENSGSAFQWTLKQDGYDCTTVTTKEDFAASLAKVKDIKDACPAIVITNSMQVEKEAKEANIPVIIQEINPSTDYKKLLAEVHKIVPKPEQGIQTGMNK